MNRNLSKLIKPLSSPLFKLSEGGGDASMGYNQQIAQDLRLTSSESSGSLSEREGGELMSETLQEPLGRDELEEEDEDDDDGGMSRPHSRFSVSTSVSLN